MAKLKYTITMIRTVKNSDFEVKTDQECLEKVREYCKDDVSFVGEDVFGNANDKLDIDLV